MDHFNHIQKKLHGFIKKYYTSEIIKGSILFLSFGLLYFIFTLFIEYFLWLSPVHRMILFWLFILVEILLLIQFIFIPIFKLYGFKKGLSPKQASKIIGKHFKEIDDKLLNILQLSEEKEKSELLLAGIEQKSAGIRPVPFKKAVDLKTNRKYLKYLGIPLLIWLFTSLTGNNSVFTKSLERVVHYNVAYQPPVPFYFVVSQQDLKVIEGKSFDLKVQTKGETVPQFVKVHFNNKETFILKSQQYGTYSYHLERVDQPVTFYLEANGLESKEYYLQLIPTPNILDFKMIIDYPDYIDRSVKTIKNTGNITIPAGTKITWNLKTRSTEKVLYKDEKYEDSFKKLNQNEFSFTRKILNNTVYQISSSNTDLKNYEKLNYHIKVIKDEYPEIKVKTDIDSISRGDAHFACVLNDDHAIKKLQVVYKETGSNVSKKVNIPVNRAYFAEAFYSFPDTLNLKKGKRYSLYFEVFDNDAVSGSKSTQSQIFYYNLQTAAQKEEALLKEQQKTFKEISKSTTKQQKLNNDLKEFNKKLKNKEEINWNDRNDFHQFMERQKQYQQMMHKKSDKLFDNLDELPVDHKNSNLEDKKEALKKRLEELKEIEKNDKLLQELEKLSEKLKKDGLIDKLDQLTEKNKQQNRSLERILEMVKQFYTEMKADQISKKLDSLAKKQTDLTKDKTHNNTEEQKKLNNEFDSIQKDFKKLHKQNNELKKPLKFPEMKKDQEIIKNEMNNAVENLKNESDQDQKSKAVKNQQNASQQMKSLSDKLKQSLQAMEGEMISENIKDLQNILKNLLNFSFKQEALMKDFDGVDASHSGFPVRIKQQQNLKIYFEHIDDSLYALSFRLVKLTAKIQTDLTSAHYNLDKSLENLSEDKVKQAITNQHYTMTAANNLADLLSDILESLKNPKLGKGKGKGKNGQSISLPDIIKKQKGINQKIKEGLIPGKKSGKSKEQMSDEIYQIYKEQSMLKEKLQELINTNGKLGPAGKKAVKQMDELEKILLEKGFTSKTIQKLQQLEYELLKLEKAAFEQGKDNKRKSTTGYEIEKKQNKKPNHNKSMYFDQDDILIRKSIPLQPFYQKKVNEFFKSKSL